MWGGLPCWQAAPGRVQLWPAFRPWFAFLLRRALFLRARFDMNVRGPFR